MSSSPHAWTRPWTQFGDRDSVANTVALTWTTTTPSTQRSFGVDFSVRTYRARNNSPAAPKILFIHGFRGDHHGMQLIVNALPEYEIHVSDLPGFGGTPPAWETTNDTSAQNAATRKRTRHDLALYAGAIHALATSLGLGAGDVMVGHSFGSIVASAAVADGIDHPQPVGWSGLALLCPISDDVFSGTLLPGALGVEAYYRMANALPDKAGNALLRAQAALWLTNRSLTVSKERALREFIRDQHRKFFGAYYDRQTLFEAYQSSSRHKIDEFADSLDLPVALIAGARDQLSTSGGRKQLLQRLPQGDLTLLRDVGHLMHYEKPDQIARALRRFIATLPRG